MKNNKLIFLSLLALLVFNCTKKMMPSNYQGKQLIFGKGGGVAGSRQEFRLLEDGKCYKKKGNEYLQVAKFGKAQTSKVFEQMATFQQSGLDLNDAGNIYHYIKLQNADGSAYTMLWSKAKETPPNIKLFYNKLVEPLDGNYGGY